MKENNQNILIISGGNLDIWFLENYLRYHEYNQIICVDGALFVADQLNLTIDWLVGDFDTVSNELLLKYEDMVEKNLISTKIRKYKPEKDATDTQIAIELAMELGANEIVLLGATGTRLDHTLGNLNLLMKPLLNDIKACIINENNKIYLINKTSVIKKQEQYGSYVSLIPLTEQVTEVTLTGFIYPLTNYMLTIGESIGISNEIQEEEASITLEKGILIVVESKD
jgi:thiamine pyrophosphokinase